MDTGGRRTCCPADLFVLSAPGRQVRGIAFLRLDREPIADRPIGEAFHVRAVD
jgi:hypothetical protein